MTSWAKDGAIDAVVWGGSSEWGGCQPADPGEQALVNRAVQWFVPDGESTEDFRNSSDPQSWKGSTDTSDATPGKVNKGVADSALTPAKR
ncbi:MAG TPA: hypothetical protein DEP53_01390 [Bacteroidetes bacterium]|nr:hypothetical protein [Bacteroidota bacterium]